jgi:co-chaperonin GroES (HSP10)|tara:strand:- start:1337 stop:1777 length:441 start_codon:yes stop_codon:yes gene_type:complete
MNDIAKSKFGSGGLSYTVQSGDIQPIGKRVLVSKMRFGDKKTRGGIILLDDDGKESGIHPRWCQVYAVGPRQEDVKIGEWLLIAHGRWSRALTVKKDGVDIEVRMIDENDILLVSDDEPADSDLTKHAGYINTGGHAQMTKMPGND